MKASMEAQIGPMIAVHAGAVMLVRCCRHGSM